MPGWTVEPTTGQPVYQNDDGTVRLRDGEGNVHSVAADQVAAMLSAPLAEFHPATADDINKQQAQQYWDKADFATKADFYAREGIKGAVDAVTSVPRAAFGAGMALAKKVTGSDAEVENPLEALSGENLVEKLDATVAGEEAARQAAERARVFSEAAPGGKAVANLAGFVAGGAALKGLGAAGELLGGADLLGDATKAARVGSMALQGAAQGYVAGAEDAWVKDQAFTADAALANMGMGAVLGGGIGAAGELAKSAVKGSRQLLAEKLFGGARFSKEAGQAAEEMAQDVTGAKPPEGFAKFFKESLDYFRDKIETVQSAVSGIPKEELEKYGGLRWTKEAISAREAWANRGPILEGVASDLTESLQTMYTESRPILDEVSRATGQKEKNLAPLLTGNADDMMAAARAKASAIEEALGKLDEEAAGDGIKSVLGSGEQVADLRDAMENVVKNVGKAEDAAGAVNALDEFKARMQRVKKNAAATSRNATSGRMIEQARERASFAEQVSNDMQSFLEDSSIWGKFGDVQARVNKAYSRVLDSDKYISSQLLERTGDDWGIPRYVVDPSKVQNYVQGLGTAKTKILDDMVRDNIAAKRDLIESIVKGYGLDAHEGGLQKALDSIKSSQDLVKKAKDALGSANILEEMHNRAASSRAGLSGTVAGGLIGHAPGAALGAAADALMDPIKLMKQAVAIREIGLKWQNGISADVKQAFMATGASAAAAVGKAAGVAQTAATRMIATHEERGAQYEKDAKNVAEAVADPVALAQKLGPAMGDVAPAAVRDMMVSGAIRTAHFLNSKLPGPVYSSSPLQPQQLTPIAPAQQARFLRYMEAANDPNVVFRELRSGITPAAEHIETLKVCYPALYERAQQVVLEAVHSDQSGKTIPYQARLALAELFDVPGAIEPTLDPGFMARLTQTAQQGAHEEAQKNAPQQQSPQHGRKMKKDVSESMQSPLNTLHI